MDIYAESAVGNTEILPYGDATFQIVDGAEGGVVAYCHEASADRIVAALIAARIPERPRNPETPDSVRDDGSIINITTVQAETVGFGFAGFVDEVTYVTDWTSRPLGYDVAYTPWREDADPDLTARLRSLNNHNVALWVTTDPSMPPTVVEFNDFGPRV